MKKKEQPNTNIESVHKARDIKYVATSALRVNPKNRNHHSPDQIDRLVKIIKYQGFRNPLVVSNRSGLLVAGHGRLMASIKMGLDQLPVIYQDFDDEEQEIAAGVSDNAIASWAELDLSGINADIGDLGPDFDIDLLGIKNFEIDVADKFEGDPDVVPEVPVEPKTKLGDVYQLGKHRLMCGDSTSIDAIERLMNDEEVDMVFTDPPYGISVVHGGGASSKTGFVGARNAPGQLGRAREYRPIIGDDEPFDPGLILGLGFKTIILWGANHYASRLPDKAQWLIWDKKLESGSLDHNNFSDCELAWTNTDALAAKIYRHTWAGMLRKGERAVELKDRVHPTQKPVGLCSEVIVDFSKEKQSVMDLYGGSGSTLIACEKTNRKCFMMELDPKYCDVIVTRWEQFTGKKAELING